MIGVCRVFAGRKGRGFCFSMMIGCVTLCGHVFGICVVSQDVKDRLSFFFLVSLSMSCRSLIEKSMVQRYEDGIAHLGG